MLKTSEAIITLDWLGFLGIGSEVYSAVEMGRRGVGFELKPSYFRQAVKNLLALSEARTDDLFLGAAE